MKFYLVRHGQTDWNIQRRFQGRTNIPMNEAGIVQMKELADRLADKGIEFDAIITSPLDRAKDTAKIIADKTGFSGEIIIDEDFIERDGGLLEGSVWSPELDMDSPKYKMETVQEMYDRSERALKKYDFPQDAKVLIVSHGSMLTAFRSFLSDYKIDFYDSEACIIQGKALCIEKEPGKQMIIQYL